MILHTVIIIAHAFDKLTIMMVSDEVWSIITKIRTDVSVIEADLEQENKSARTS